MFRTSTLAVAIAMAASGVVRASIIGFGGDGSGYSLNKHGSFQSDGPSITSNVLTITDHNSNEANSTFDDTVQSYAAGFTASFSYAVSGDADGFVFVLQNDSRGASAAGGNGGSLGYGGGSDKVTPSLGISFNIDPINGGSRSGIDDSGNVSYVSTGSVDITNGTPVDVVIAYDAASTTVSETLTQGSFTFSQSRIIDLSSTLGNNGFAYVGFTGGTGDHNAVQTISNFSYADVPEPAAISLLAIGAMIGIGRRTRGAAVDQGRCDAMRTWTRSPCGSRRPPTDTQRGLSTPTR